MWKKFLSLLKGNKKESKKDDVREPVKSEVEKSSKVDLNPMFSKLFEDEFAFLSFAQGELRKGRLLVSQSKFSEARDVLKPLVVIVKHSLIANYESERRENVFTIC